MVTRVRMSHADLNPAGPDVPARRRPTATAAATPGMPIVSRPARALIAACLVVVTLLAVAPGSAVALEPPRPLPGYRPAFVTETDTRPWTDCLWASGAMLLDKWTNGRITATHQRLRKLSGDTKAGSGLADLKVAYAKLGIDLAYSPDGGDRITWSGLLNRLAHGGGAVLLGDDSKLPRWYGRWDHRFWKGKAKTDNHAVYVERYDPKRGRVWLMDPLARGDWQGEWISVWSLQSFVWSQGGLLSAAMTPSARSAPFAHVSATGLDLTRTSTNLDATWTVKAPKRWRYPGADVKASFDPADDPLLAAVALPSILSRQGPDADLAKPTAAVADGMLRVSTPLPETPGAYVGRLALTDRRFGRTVADTGEVAMFLPGPRSANLQVSTGEPVAGAGTSVDVSISVVNSGTLSWADPSADQVPVGKALDRNARLVARWIRLADAAGDPVDDTVVPPDAVELAPVPLAPGRRVVVDVSIQAPRTIGRWALAIDVVDDIDGSYAALGSEPGFTTLDVIEVADVHAALRSAT